MNSFAESVTFGSLCSVVGSNLEFSLNVFYKIEFFLISPVYILVFDIYFGITVPKFHF